MRLGLEKTEGIEIGFVETPAAEGVKDAFPVPAPPFLPAPEPPPFFGDFGVFTGRSASRVVLWAMSNLYFATDQSGLPERAAAVFSMFKAIERDFAVFWRCVRDQYREKSGLERRCGR